MEPTNVNPSNNTEDTSGPYEEPTMEKEYDMAGDVKLLLPAVETVLIKMDELHKDMSRRDEVAADLSAVRAEVQEAKATSEPVAPTTNEAEVPRVEAEAEVVNEILTSYEAPIVEDIDAVQADAEANDDDLPFSSTADAGDVEEDDEENDGEDANSPGFPDSHSDLDDDDEDDDEDDFTIQY
ncbi:pheromone-processing carboxypeptidase KEX1-like [Cynara cardunculus var. scolymus]|uniref:pheromone-processing carboxypeptidase KEX1-like n=1 Tax=Cynara cardunculus var. scolymus TaxID=59895 RepID=UPI000D6243C8|nr:pheromone-processing carboxypeptidase KEX1-like [Cynara cardunculus var. scolymus]